MLEAVPHHFPKHHMPVLEAGAEELSLFPGLERCGTKAKHALDPVTGKSQENLMGM